MKLTCRLSRLPLLSLVACLLYATSPGGGASAVAAEVRTVGGNGADKYVGDGGPATRAGIGQPFGLVIGPDKALYVCEVSNHTVRRIDSATGVITTVAGSGKKGYSGDGGPATAATCGEPYEVRFDNSGNMYFVEMVNHLVRKVDAKTKIISTVAGTGKPGFDGDGGPATKALFKSPHSIAFDTAGDLYICDIGNHRVRKVDMKSGLVSTFAGTGEKLKTPDGARITGTPFNGPRALDADGRGGFILALREGNAVYRLDLKSGTAHHLAGTGKQGYSGDGGPAKDAALAGPKGVAVAPNGDIFLADTESHTIRVIRAASGVIETVIGNGKKGNGPDGNPRECKMDRPHGVFVDADGSIYVGDSNNHAVRKLAGQKPVPQ